MSFLRSMLDRLRRPLQTVRPAPPEAASTEPAVLDAAPAGESGLDEFGSFLADMGAEPVTPEESTLAIKDATIAELQRNLAHLRPLGDRLAETERARLALVDEVAQLREQLEQVRAECAERDRKLERSERKLKTSAERLKRMRTKFEERKRVVADRWFEIVELRKEKKQLARRAQETTPSILVQRERSPREHSMAWLLAPDPKRTREEMSQRAPLES